MLGQALQNIAKTASSHQGHKQIHFLPFLFSFFFFPFSFFFFLLLKNTLSAIATL